MKQSGLMSSCLLFVLLFSCGSVKNLPLSSGTILSYDIVTSQKSVRLNATLLESNSLVEFDYVVENEDIDGNVKITQQALETSNEVNHIFNGEDKLLTKSTSLYISAKSFGELKDSGRTVIAFRQGFLKNEMTYKVVDRQDIKFNFNQKPKSFHVLYLEDMHGKGFKFWIWDNPSTPLILT